MSHRERRSRRGAAVAEVAAGMDLAAAAAKHAIGGGYLRQLCQRAGISVADRRRQQGQVLRLLRIVAALQNEPDVPISEIASRFGITRQRASQVLVQAGRAGLQFPGRR